MSGDESFLARWSRRKRNLAAPSAVEKNPPPSAAETPEPVSPATGEAAPVVPLPPIESIVSASDIKAFLAPGVPLELTRAALRRAWTSDPAIRDFIGLSENAWDFNAPGGVPGFGSLDFEEVRRLAAELLDGPRSPDPVPALAVEGRPAMPTKPSPPVPISELRESIAAAQHKNGERKPRECPPRRAPPIIANCSLGAVDSFHR